MQIDLTDRPARSRITRAWFRLAQNFAATLRGARHQPGGLLLVGTEDHEPWHFAAHLADIARYTGQAQLAPTLVRHAVPAGARAHLATDLSRLSGASRADTILVSAPTAPSPHLLERLDDARRSGALLLALDAGQPELGELAHESLAVPGSGLAPAQPGGGVPSAGSNLASFDLAEHLLTVAAGAHRSVASGRGLLRRQLSSLPAL
jgi:hypothetical protein